MSADTSTRRIARSIRERSQRLLERVNNSHLGQWAAFMAFAGACELLIVVALNIIGTKNFDWGNVPTWIGANLTAATLSLALAISIGDSRDREADRSVEAEDRRLDAAERRDRAKQQARLVTASVGNGSLVITNYSDAPVLRMRVKLDSGNIVSEIVATAMGKAFRKADVPDIPVLAGGKSRSVPLPGIPDDAQIESYKQKSAIDLLTSAALGQSLPEIVLRFTDANGRRWTCRHTILDSEEPEITQIV